MDTRAVMLFTFEYIFVPLWLDIMFIFSLNFLCYACFCFRSSFGSSSLFVRSWLILHFLFTDGIVHHEVRHTNMSLLGSTHTGRGCECESETVHSVFMSYVHTFLVKINSMNGGIVLYNFNFSTFAYHVENVTKIGKFKTLGNVHSKKKYRRESEYIPFWLFSPIRVFHDKTLLV